MLVIINGNDSEVILESNYEKYEEINGTALQISFDSYKFENNYGHDLIDYNVRVEDEDGHVYVIKQLTNFPNQKRVLANHEYYELIGNRRNQILQGQYNFTDLADWLFSGTGWTYTLEDAVPPYNFNSFGNDNVISLVQKLKSFFNLEMQIMPNKVIRFARTIGERNDLQYRYKNNIKEISQSFDTTNVRTRVFAYGKDGIQAVYTSELALNPRFGIIEAEPIRDESLETHQQLIEFARQSLNDKVDINVEASVLDVDGKIGEYVWLIHEELGLEYETRIISKTSKRDYEESVVEIGNVKRQTIEDAIINQKEEVKQNREEANQAVNELDEKTTAQTEEVRLFVENVEQTLNSSITLTATQIRSEVNDVENRLNSSITQTASSIRLEVQQVDRNVASLEITADRIQSNVTNLENSTNSSITQLSNNINLKVDVGGTISDINLSPGNATINADRIDLNGAVFVNGRITGNTDIVVGNNAAVGNALYFGGSRSSFDFIEISGGDMTFNSFGDFMFSGGNLYVNGRRVLTEDDLT